MQYQYALQGSTSSIRRLLQAPSRMSTNCLDFWAKKYYSIGQKKWDCTFFGEVAFCSFGISLVKALKIHFFTYQKILLSSRAFQISGFRQERVNRSGDVHSRRAFTHPTSEKLIAELKKLAIAIFNPVHIEDWRRQSWPLNRWYFRVNLSSREGELVAGLWDEKEKGALKGGPRRQEGWRRAPRRYPTKLKDRWCN